MIAKEAGVNPGDPVVFGTKADGSQGFKPVTDKTLSNIEKNRQDVQQRTKDAYSDPTLSLKEREKINKKFLKNVNKALSSKKVIVSF